MLEAKYRRGFPNMQEAKGTSIPKYASNYYFFSKKLFPFSTK